MNVKKILIIEDNETISQLLGETLQELGYEIDFAFNGKEGIDHLINHVPPDLILLDLFLPIMNGTEFRSRQLQIPELANIPIVVMSGDSYVKQRCAPLHIKHFLKKPFEMEDLIRVIESFRKRSLS